MERLLIQWFLGIAQALIVSHWIRATYVLVVSCAICVDHLCLLEQVHLAFKTGSRARVSTLSNDAKSFPRPKRQHRTI